MTYVLSPFVSQLCLKVRDHSIQVRFPTLAKAMFLLSFLLPSLSPREKSLLRCFSLGVLLAALEL